MNWGSAETIQFLSWLCMGGVGLAVIAALAHFMSLSKEKPSFIASSLGQLSTILLGVAALIGFYGLWLRYREVNHFPSQTMSEVVSCFAVATLLAGVVVHFVLQWKRYGIGAQGLGFLLQALVFIAAGLTLFYVRSMPTTERDLPPALQSYWFPPHLTALIFSYGTLSIAALLVFLYFAFQACRELLAGNMKSLSLWGTMLFIFLVPFSHLITIPLFLVLVLPIALGLHFSGRGFSWLPEWGKTLDDLSFRVFAVGFPFLTAGVMMGALWAQESWANYWGWDSKEVTALLTWIVYLVYLHLRFVAGWRGPKSMKILLAGAVSIFITFQLFGYLPDSQKSLHRYTDPDVVPQEGMQGGNK